MGIEVSNADLQRIEKKFSAICSDEVIERGLKKGCLLILRKAKETVPVDTHYLQESITVNGKGLDWEVGTPVEYAGFVEYGTKYQSAKPYLIPSVESSRKAIKTFILEEIGKEAERYND